MNTQHLIYNTLEHRQKHTSGVRSGALRQVFLRAKPEAGHFSLAQEVEKALNDTEKFAQGSASKSVNVKKVA